MPEIHIILGPPGTGKTTRLLSVIEQELQRGIPPDRIAFVSFTNKAVSEGVARVRAQLNVRRMDMPYFRTLHSTAFKALGLSRDMLFSGTHRDDFRERTGFHLTGNFKQESRWAKEPSDDLLEFVYTQSRIREVPMSTILREQNLQTNVIRLKRFAAEYDKYKQAQGVLDYTDMILDYNKADIELDVDVAIIDEAQDLTAQQWKMIANSFRSAARIYVAGDDDQAIYRWNGADVNRLIQMPGQVEVLGQSYRVPIKPQEIALTISSKINNRRYKQWNPRPEMGGVFFYNSHETLPLWGDTEQNWLILSRNFSTPMMRSFIGKLRAWGLPYVIRAQSSYQLAEAKAIDAYFQLRAGETLRGDKVRPFMQLAQLRAPFIVTRSGEYSLKTLRLNLPENPYHVFRTVPPKQLQYLMRVHQRHGQLEGLKSNIELSTIHGAKGGECQNVVVMTDVTRATYLALKYGLTDDEHRVFYVAVTRAKENLHIIMPQWQHFYDPLANMARFYSINKVAS